MPIPCREPPLGSSPFLLRGQYNFHGSTPSSVNLQGCPIRLTRICCSFRRSVTIATRDCSHRQISLLFFPGQRLGNSDELVQNVADQYSQDCSSVLAGLDSWTVRDIVIRERSRFPAEDICASGRPASPWLTRAWHPLQHLAIKMICVQRRCAVRGDVRQKLLFRDWRPQRLPGVPQIPLNDTARGDFVPQFAVRSRTLSSIPPCAFEAL